MFGFPHNLHRSVACYQQRQIKQATVRAVRSRRAPSVFRMCALEASGSAGVDPALVNMVAHGFSFPTEGTVPRENCFVVCTSWCKCQKDWEILDLDPPLCLVLFVVCRLASPKYSSTHRFNLTRIYTSLQTKECGPNHVPSDVSFSGGGGWGCCVTFGKICFMHRRHCDDDQMDRDFVLPCVCMNIQPGQIQDWVEEKEHTHTHTHTHTH